MWGSLLVLGLLLSLHPLRLGVTLLVISRSRPMQNLITYWVGSLVVGFMILIVPLIVLHFVPALSSLTTAFANPATNPATRYIAIGLGVLALLAAAVMALRSPARSRKRAASSGGRHRLDGAKAGGPSTLVLDDDPVNPISRLLGPRTDDTPDDDSFVRRLFGRIRNAWESGALWVSFVIGLFMGPSLDGALFVLAIIVASGAAMGSQIVAAVTFMVAMLAVEEVILISNVAAPAKTQVFLRRLQHWAEAHRRKVLVAIFAVIGISLVIQGIAA